ncbi:MAG: zinc ribbon domain-containing protein [Methanobacteriaceae archaeon]|nr:zinc ribbon domain-containing protein [Methanobacteriaceae archaeon]
MICENCGAKISKWETYCPKCGMDLISSEHKPLQQKFLRGEYRDVEEVTVKPYNLEDEDYFEDKYQKKPYAEPHQNWDDYDPDFTQEYDEDEGRNRGKTRKYSDQGYDQDYHQDKDYNNRYNHKNRSRRKYKKNYPKQKKYLTRGYDLDDEYFDSEPKSGSIWTTVILFLVVALLMGFVMGFIFFSGRIQNIFH